MTALSTFDSFKLNRYKTQFGEMSAEEALNLALNAEDIKKAMNNFDPSKARFAEEQHHMFEYAVLLEKEANK